MDTTTETVSLFKRWTSSKFNPPVWCLLTKATEILPKYSYTSKQFWLNSPSFWEMLIKFWFLSTSLFLSVPKALYRSFGSKVQTTWKMENITFSLFLVYVSSWIKYKEKPHSVNHFSCYHVTFYSSRAKKNTR